MTTCASSSSTRARTLFHAAHGETPSWSRFLDDETASHVLPQARAVAEGRVRDWSGEVQHTWPGVDLWLQVSLTPVRLAHRDVPAVSMQLVDITARKAAERDLRRAATHDTLTGLPNRTLLDDRLDLALQNAGRSGRPVGLLFLDVDDFQVVNDGCGHAVGDEVLGAVAARITDAVRPGDTVARVGGDEFVVLCPELDDATDARRVAERIVESFTESLGVPQLRHLVGVSVGVAVSGSDSSPTTLLRDAEHAMYAAKRAGKGRSEVSDPLMEAAAERRTRLLTRLRTAISQNEFTLHFQPLVDLGSSAVVAVEALCRWNDPERGLLAPGEFLDVIEQSDLVVPFSQWVLRTACQHGAIWQREFGEAAPALHVNVSASHLRHRSFAQHLRESLADTGLDPHLMVLEITETQLLATTPSLRRELDRVREAGVRIAVDDYGTGYSSLSHITDFDVDILKIDKSFVIHMDDNKAARAIVEAVAIMGSTLGMEVVAEGVERQDHADRLKQLGAATGQGFLWSAGRPAEEISRLIAGSCAPVDDPAA